MQQEGIDQRPDHQPLHVIVPEPGPRAFHRDHRGFLLVNVFARISEDQWPIITEVGLRVWQRGVEQVRIEAVAE